MTWLGLLAIIVACFQIAVVVRVERGVAEVRRHATRWGELATTQLKHETDIRYLRELVNPMARSGKAPMPRHLRREPSDDL